MVKTRHALGGGQRPDPWSGKIVYAAQPKKKILRIKVFFALTLEHFI